jgi:hypothetical protein
MRNNNNSIPTMITVTSCGVGLLNGYSDKEGGLPNSVVHGVVGLSGLLGSIASMRKNDFKCGSNLVALFISGPLVMSMYFGIGHFSGKAIRHTQDLYQHMDNTNEKINKE